MIASSIDWWIFVAYLILVFAFGLYMSRREATASDFFLAGRRLPWYAIAISLFASNISSSGLIALAGDAYRYGIAVSTLEWGAILGLTLLVFVYLPYYRNATIFTTPEFLERRYGPAARMLFALTVIAVELLVYMPYMFFAGGLFLGVLFDLPFVWSVIGIATFVGLYTTIGGLGAVVWTDVIQGVLMIVGGAIVTILALARIGGITTFIAQVPEGHLSVSLPVDHPAYPFPATMIGGYMLVTIYYWCHNQTIVQRTFGGRTDWDARMGAIGACYIKLILPFVIVLPGVLAVVLIPDLGIGKEADQALPLLIKEVVPSGLMGVIMAAMIASLMSSADSGLNSLATIFTNDFYRRWVKPNASENRLVLVGRIASVGILLISVARALTMDENPSLMQFLQVGLSYLASPVIVVFAAGVFWRGATAAGAATTLLVAPLVSYLCQHAYSWIPWWPSHMVYWMPITVGILFSILFIVSQLTPRKSDEELSGLIWSRADALGKRDDSSHTEQAKMRESATPSRRWLDYRLWAVVAIVLMLIEICWLW